MRPKLIVTEQGGKAIFGAWASSVNGKVIIGWRAGQLKAVKIFLGERVEAREIGEGKTHFRLQLEMKWDELLKKIRNEGMIMHEVRGFRRLIH